MPAPDYATEIAQLEAGLSSGEATIEDEKVGRVTYRSVTEITTALQYFRDKVAAGTPGAAVPFVTAASFSRY